MDFTRERRGEGAASGVPCEGKLQLHERFELPEHSACRWSKAVASSADPVGFVDEPDMVREPRMR